MFAGLSLLVDHPRSGLAAIAVVVIAFTILIIVAPPPDGPAKREAYDRAKLECRLSGGNYEYFGTQGYHCIGGKK